MSPNVSPEDTAAAAQEFKGWLLKRQTSPEFLAIVRGALAVLDRQLGPGAFKHFIPNDPRSVGLAAFLPIVDIARVMTDLESARALSENFVKDLRANKFAETLPVMRIAAALASSGFDAEVEPELVSNGRLRRPDLKTAVDGRDVCIEVTAPDTSQVQSEISKLMQRVTAALAPFALPCSIGVCIQDQLSTGAEQKLVAACQNIITGGTLSHEIEGVTIITGENPLEVQQLLRDVTPGASLFTAAGTIGADPPAQFVIRAPYTDRRVARLLGDKRRHGQLTRAQANILVVDSTRVPLLIPDWDAGVRNFLVDYKNRRISAILHLRSLNFFDRIEIRHSLYYHPNPYFQVPDPLVGALDQYFSHAGIDGEQLS